MDAADAASELISELERKAGRGELLYVGEDIAPLDSLDKVFGRAVYAGDLVPNGAVHVKIVRSAHSHARILGIGSSAAFSIPGVLAVLTHTDVPGVNASSALIPDRPLLANGIVRSTGDVVAAVVAERPSAAEDAAGNVTVDYAPLPAVLDPLEALMPGAPDVRDGGNVAGRAAVRRGDAALGFREADLTVEGTYRTQAHDPGSVEPQVGIAVPGEGVITLIGRLRNPYAARESVAMMLGVQPGIVRVTVPTGGGPVPDGISMDAVALAALAAAKTGRPAICSLDRSDAAAMGPAGLPAVITHRTGVSSDGRFLASEIRLYLDAGPYTPPIEPLILRAALHAAGAYDIPNVDIEGYAVHTNNAVGFTWGLGVPQASFAVEAHVDEIAGRLGMDPLELRLRNMLRPGSRTVTGQAMDASCGLPDCVDAVVGASDYGAKRAARSGRGAARYRRGIGMAIVYHGNPVGSEGDDYAVVRIIIGRDGRIHLGTGLADTGTGSIMGIIQIAAGVLGAPPGYFAADMPDTSAHGLMGPSGESGITTMCGMAARGAARVLRKRLNLVAADILGCRPEAVAIVDGRAFCTGGGTNTIPWEELVAAAYDRGTKMEEVGHYAAPKREWDPGTGHGDPYHQYTFGAAVAEVEVDTETGVYRVTDYYVAIDVGRAINPAGLRVWIEGGSIRGLGYATMEELVRRDGRIVNPPLAGYYVPTSMDVPDIHTFIVERPGSMGPFGAKDVSESPVELPAPAIRNAIMDAIGAGLNRLPMTPEAILTGTSTGKGGDGDRPRASS
ncbi:MAG: xanthine dehydrogenase family protein molybdopterin-binding subunit [Nitrososphaeria archaeon]